YLLARRLRTAERWAIAAGWTTALWPLLMALPLGLATENLFIPLVTFGLWALLRADDREGARAFWLPGLAFGLASLTRSVIIGFPGLAALWTWRSGRRRAAIVLLLPVLALTIPWSVRNTLLHDRPTFVESSLGYNLYLGYHPESDGSFQFGPSLDLITVLDDAERDRIGRRMAWEFIKDDPGRVPGLMLSKLGHFWGLEDRAFIYLYSNGLLGPLPPPVVVALYTLLIVPLIFVLPLAIVGWILPPHARAWQLIGLLFAWYIGVHLLILSDARFHLALIPLLAALAARGLTKWDDWFQRVKHGEPRARRAAALAAGLICLAFLNWGLELASQADQLAILFGPDGWQAGFHY
ncbi:MAG: glycosyltransferase family 39 protein, partial [Anaerolineales bacterium]|nr:glycosyltransferase family 39 protein [Anaerolineales bacterium]